MDDPHTGQLMSVSEVQETIDALDLTSMQLGQGRAAYKHAMKTLPAMPEAQRKAIAVEKKYKIGKVLDKLCNDDMFTSRFEVYVSFPMFYAEVAQELAVKLNMCKIGSHNVAAWISYEGKKTPAQQVNDTSNPATIGYIGLINKATLEADLKDYLDHAICKRDMHKEGDAMKEYLHPDEIEQLQETMTYKLAVQFRHRNTGTAHALFQTGGFI